MLYDTARWGLYGVILQAEYHANSIRLRRVLCTSCVILPLAVICALRIRNIRRMEYHCEAKVAEQIAEQYYCPKGNVTLCGSKEYHL